MPSFQFPQGGAASAIEQAQALYAKQGHDFQKDFEEHLRTGFVVALPTCFAMAQATTLDDKNIDAWFVKVAVGDLRLLTRLIPFPLRFIAFCKLNSADPKRLRVYRTDRLKHLANQLSGSFPRPKPIPAIHWPIATSDKML